MLYGGVCQRPSLLPAHDGAEPGLDRGGGCDAGARHWGQHDAILGGQWCAAQSAALPDRLIALYSRTSDSPRWSISYPNFLDWVRDNRSFSALAGYRSEDYNLTGMGEPERLPGEMVSATFFLLLGVKPALGRMFLPEEDQVGARPVVLISDGLWKRKFGSAPDAVGKTVTLNGEGYTIVGVIPASSHYSGNNFGSST